MSPPAVFVRSMKTLLRRRVLAPLFGLTLVEIQFFPPTRNLGSAEGPDDISHKAAVPADVHRLLAEACYDCHSNRTRYPWYAGVQPVGWWLNHHVHEGKRELNFSQFGAYPAKRAARKLDAIVDEVEHGDMPLRSYAWMHPAARLTATERKMITTWAEALHDKIQPD
ncbi:MAG TPA: heme-binding domain-containing protein [Opitutaceae bacterium]|nr:heme-binding domain-containing protein [Opitutaceae bacterium]